MGLAKAVRQYIWNEIDLKGSLDKRKYDIVHMVVWRYLSLMIPSYCTCGKNPYIYFFNSKNCFSWNVVSGSFSSPQLQNINYKYCFLFQTEYQYSGRQVTSCLLIVFIIVAGHVWLCNKYVGLGDYKMNRVCGVWV